MCAGFVYSYDIFIWWRSYGVLCLGHRIVFSATIDEYSSAQSSSYSYSYVWCFCAQRDQRWWSTPFMRPLWSRHSGVIQFFFSVAPAQFLFLSENVPQTTLEHIWLCGKRQITFNCVSSFGGRCGCWVLVVLLNENAQANASTTTQSACNFWMSYACCWDSMHFILLY